MNTKIFCALTFLGMAVFFGSNFSPSAASADGNPSATGHVTVFLNSGQGVEGRSSLSFNAVRHEDGTVTGHATLQGRDNTFHADINCLRIDGNTAHMSGTVTKSEIPIFQGGTMFITATDNGEGTNDPPDQVSALVISAVGLFDCNADVVSSVANVEKGNIQVRP